MRRLFRPKSGVEIDGVPAAPQKGGGMSSILPQPDIVKRRHHASVTPFPMPSAPPPGDNSGLPPPPPLQQQQQQAPAPPPPAMRLGRPPPPAAPERVATPSDAEIRQMQDDAINAASYRRGGDVGDRAGYPVHSRVGTGASNDTWANPGAQPGSNMAEPPEAQYYGGQSQQPSPVTQPSPHLYLPPGAGPPDVQQTQQFRPSTPTRLGHLQTPSVGTNGSLPVGGYAADLDGGYASARSRGYSSASQSGRGSDHEGSVHHMPAPQLNKPTPMPPSTRSPLVNAFPEPQPPAAPAPAGYAVPPPHAYNQWSKAQPPPPPPPQNGPPSDRVLMRPDADNYAPSSKSDKHDKGDKGDKKRFWNVGWGGPKGNKGKEFKDTPSSIIEPPPPIRRSLEGTRPSFDDWRDADISNHGHGSSIGHSLEDTHRSKLRPMEPVRSTVTAQEAADEVATLIRAFCTSHETTYTNVVQLCEQINNSEYPDAVSRETAKTIRKQLKQGADPERRMAARVWLITMRAITTGVYRPYATNKKFLSVVEAILLNNVRQQPSKKTYDTIMNIVSGLTNQFSRERGCEGLIDLWRKVKPPQEPEEGRALPDDFLQAGGGAGGGGNNTNNNTNPVSNDYQRPPPIIATGPSPLPSPPPSVPVSRPGSQPSLQRLSLADHRFGGGQQIIQPTAPYGGGPGYQHLPDHKEDMRRLMEECTAAKESARVLAESIVFTQPAELQHKPIIKEFYRKTFLAHESLTGQMDWAQAEAAKARREAESVENNEQHLTTLEEVALAQLFEAHSVVADALKQYDDLEKMAADEQEMRAVQERSKKETRLDRRQQMDMLVPGEAAEASASRSPSPHHAALGGGSRVSPQENHDRALPHPAAPAPQRHLGESPTNQILLHAVRDGGRSRTPSPDRRGLPEPPRVPSSPARNPSPVGRSRVPGPRPLPSTRQLRSVNSPSTHSLTGLADGPHHPSRGGSGSTNNGNGSGSGAEGDAEEEDDNSDAPPSRPSRKALGKRRAEPVDPDNDFSPDDLFGVPKKPETNDDEAVTADEVYLPSKPIKYAYDAYQEKLDQEAAESVRAGGGSGGGGSAIATAPTVVTAVSAR